MGNTVEMAGGDIYCCTQILIFDIRESKLIHITFPQIIIKHTCETTKKLQKILLPQSSKKFCYHKAPKSFGFLFSVLPRKRDKDCNDVSLSSKAILATNKADHYQVEKPIFLENAPFIQVKKTCPQDSVKISSKLANAKRTHA